MKNPELCSPEQALPGRTEAMPLPAKHLVLGTPYGENAPAGFRHLHLGMGCFWGAERLFWQMPGVWRTAVGYGGGYTPNPTYREVCSGKTAHCELVEIVYDPALLEFDRLLRVFWEHHDPTQGMRQGNDLGSQYRSAIYAADTIELELAKASRYRYEEALKSKGYESITTEIRQGVSFYYAEVEHQQYLHTHPQGYCGLAGTGVSCPISAPGQQG